MQYAPLSGAREPCGQWGQMTPQKFTLGGQTWYFNRRIFWKEIFSGTHPHVVTEAIHHNYIMF